MTTTADIPEFGSLAESREFFAVNPQLNPVKAPENGVHENGGYVKSKGRGRIVPRVPVTPYRITDVFLQEQFDSEGDTVWALWGRGLMGCTYSIREVEHLLSTVMTPGEQAQASARRQPLRSLIVRLDSDSIVPADLEAAPELQVVADVAVAAEEPAQLALAETQPAWTPPRDHPWRTHPDKTKEVAA